MRTPSPPHLPRPPYCRTSAKSSILWAISKTTVSIAIRQRRQQYRLTNLCASPMKGLRPATMRGEVVHGCSPYSISSMTLPRRQRTTWSRLPQRWIRLYKTAPHYWQLRHYRRRQQQQQCQCRRCTFPYHLPNRRRSLPGRRILEDKRVLSIRRHPRTDAQSHRNIARLHASHRRTARPRSHYLPVSPRSQPVVHTAVVHMAVIHAAHTARNCYARTTVSEATRTRYFSSFSSFSSAFNSESTCPLARTL